MTIPIVPRPTHNAASVDKREYAPQADVRFLRIDRSITLRHRMLDKSIDGRDAANLIKRLEHKADSDARAPQDVPAPGLRHAKEYRCRDCVT